MTVICDLSGVPQQDEPQFRQWAQVLFSVETLPKEARAQQKLMLQYLLPLVEQERTSPSDNLLDTLVKAQQQGDTTAIITGGGSGIGRATAASLARRGSRVIVAYMNRDIPKILAKRSNRVANHLPKLVEWVQ